MWSIFSRDPAKDFAYILGEKITGLEDKSVWTLHQGKKKATGEPVSIFAFDVKGNSETQAALARSSFKRIKTLRHPNILTFLDGIETDKVIYIATEPVTPLEKGLAFLVNDCGLIHNNVCMSSIYVDQAGEWKLGGVDYMYPATGAENIPPVKILPYLERYDPPEKSELRRGIRGDKWSSDMWGLGCLIWEVFNGPLPRANALKAFGKIPKNFVPNYCELVSANPNSRPNPAKFIEDCSRKGGFLNNPFIKDQGEKSKFFSKLTDALDSFPKQLSRHKVLPQLLHAYEFGNCGSMVLAPLFKVGQLLDNDEYQAKIVPCVVKLFTSSDRNTRVRLLQQIELFVEHLQAQTVNDKIFPNIAMMHLAPKLNYKNLNEELMKHFARLQAKDDQGGIRTNTTVCLGKIASYLNPQMRQRILCSAFLRGIKDPFPPARQAGVIGIGATQHLFTMADAFKTLKSFLDRLEKLSEDPDMLPELEKDVMSGGVPNNSAAGWAGWAIGGVSTLTSKVYSKATKKPTNAGPTLKGKASPDAPGVPSPTSQTPTSTSPSQPEVQDSEENEGEGQQADAGWDDDDGDWGDIDTPATSAPTVKRSEPSHQQAPPPDDGWGADDDDDDWGDIDVTPAEVPRKSDKTYNNTNPDSHGISKSNSSVSDSSARTKQSNQSDWGWGDTDMSEFESASKVPSKPVKGALKLGSQKKQAPAQDFGWIEEEFAPIEDKSVKPASSYNWGETETLGGSDFFTMKDSGSKSIPAANKQSEMKNQNQSVFGNQSGMGNQSELGNTEGDSGWGSTGGWEDDSWGALTESKESEADRKKREREEKRQQRQRELAEKRQAKKAGAMKLGSKLTND
ncbi:SCYL1-like protein [Mya arenaria]|uniref:N-terminal kinase-like protein n=1 Tax=Mya arenaria TaxID=6604 RepID=A0ABY7FEE1_MYAAR|nr:SCYL1-like protein [Mya arenaria]